MRLGKMTLTGLAFAVGACVFVTTAFADMALGTGYDRLKDTVKHTAAQMEEGLDNYTAELLYEWKVDDVTIIQSSTVKKYDTIQQAAEDVTVKKRFDGETSTRWSYFEPEMHIYKGDDDKYYVTERNPRSSDDAYVFRSPFRKDWAEDAEKIADALVGNLKEYVQVEENAAGEKIYSGSLTQLQVPALINAVGSFYMKQIMDDLYRYNDKLPEFNKDIYVKKVTGTAVEDKNGLLKSLHGEIAFSGKDGQGQTHDVSYSVVFKLTDVGKTRVVKPDLSGKTVEVNTANGFSDKYVGKYKSNIVIEKDGEFVKVGERTLEIVSVKDGVVSGRYYETVKPEFASEYPDSYDFTFKLPARDNVFTYKNAAGEEETGVIHTGMDGNIYLDLNVEVHDSGDGSWGYGPKVDARFFSGELIRIFEE